MNLYDMKTIYTDSKCDGSHVWEFVVVGMYVFIFVFIYIYTTSFTLNSDKALVLDYTSISMLR